MLNIEQYKAAHSPSKQLYFWLFLNRHSSGFTLTTQCIALEAICGGKLVIFHMKTVKKPCFSSSFYQYVSLYKCKHIPNCQLVVLVSLDYKLMISLPELHLHEQCILINMLGA